MRCRGAITASIRPSAHVATFRRLPAATCPPRPGLSRSSDVHHQNASRAMCAATTELASVGRCFLARRGNTVARGQVSVVAMRPRAPHCLVLSTPPRRQAPWWVGRVLSTRKPPHAIGRKPGNMARKSGGLPAPVLAIPEWAVHAVGYRTADRLSDLFPQCDHVACRITRDAPWRDVALLVRDWPLVAADAR